MSKIGPIMCVCANEGKTQVRWIASVGQRMLKNELMQTTLPKDPPIVYQTRMKWLWNPFVYKLLINIMEMGVHKTNEQMGKVDPRCRYKIAIPKKWLFKIMN
jgi:hypothetical protein